MSEKEKPQEKPEESVVKAIGKAGGYDTLIKYGELTVDAFTDPGLLRDIPLVGTIVALGRAGFAVRDVLLMRKLQAFLGPCKDLPKEREEFVRKMNEDVAKRNKVGTHLLVLLERFEEVDKARLLGKAFSAYLGGLVELDEYWRMARAIDRCMMDDLMIGTQNKSAEIVANRPHVAADFLACGLMVEMPSIGPNPRSQYSQLIPPTMYRWTEFGQRFVKLVLM